MSANTYVDAEDWHRVFGRSWGWANSPKPEPLHPLAWGPTPAQGPMIGPTNGLPRTWAGALCTHSLRTSTKVHHLDLPVGRGNEGLMRAAGKSLGSSSDSAAKVDWGWCMTQRRAASLPQLPLLASGASSLQSSKRAAASQ